MIRKCLLLKLPDEREIFTAEKHQSQLAEFIRVFGIKVFTVEAEISSLTSVKDVSKIFCTQEEQPEVKYKVVATESRKKILQKVYDVRSYIESLFLEGETVRIKELHHKFRKHNLAVSTLYRHLNHVKIKLEEDGKKVIKTSVGCYKLS